VVHWSRGVRRVQPLLQRYMGEPRERRRRLVLFVAAAVILAYGPFDVVVGRGPLLLMALLRLCWATLLVVLGLAAQRLGAHGWRHAVLLAGVASNAIFVGLVLLAGGLDSPQAVWLPVMPTVTLMLAWERVGVVALSGAVTLAGTLAMEAPLGSSALVWGSLVAGAGGLAVATSFAFLMVQRDEAQVIEARDAAQSQLGESERRRLRAERLSIAGRLAASVAHAVNSPLAAAKSNLHQLATAPVAGGADAAEHAEVVADTAAAVDHIGRVVGALRVFSQDEWAAAPPACAVASAIGDGLRAAGPLLPPGAAVRLEVAPGLPLVSVGEPLLAQVVLGLLLDAAEGSTAARPRRVTVAAGGHAEGVRLEVVDDGPGFPPGAQARLLDPTTAWTPGRGLGLGMARELLGLEGGLLELESPAEGGRRRRLWLPATPADGQRG